MWADMVDSGLKKKETQAFYAKFYAYDTYLVIHHAYQRSYLKLLGARMKISTLEDEIVRGSEDNKIYSKLKSAKNEYRIAERNFLEIRRQRLNTKSAFDEAQAEHNICRAAIYEQRYAVIR